MITMSGIELDHLVQVLLAVFLPNKIVFVCVYGLFLKMKMTNFSLRGDELIYLNLQEEGLLTKRVGIC